MPATRREWGSQSGICVRRRSRRRQRAPTRGSARERQCACLAFCPDIMPRVVIEQVVLPGPAAVCAGPSLGRAPCADMFRMSVPSPYWGVARRSRLEDNSPQTLVQHYAPACSRPKEYGRPWPVPVRFPQQMLIDRHLVAPSAIRARTRRSHSGAGARIPQERLGKGSCDHARQVACQVKGALVGVSRSTTDELHHGPYVGGRFEPLVEPRLERHRHRRLGVGRLFANAATATAAASGRGGGRSPAARR